MLHEQPDLAVNDAAGVWPHISVIRGVPSILRVLLDLDKLD
ncbi:MAG: hypothetical protein ABI336_02710 [Humibacillus sp.]